MLVIVGIIFYLLVSLGVAFEAWVQRPDTHVDKFKDRIIAFGIGLIWPVVLGVGIGKLAR